MLGRLSLKKTNINLKRQKIGATYKMRPKLSSNKLINYETVISFCICLAVVILAKVMYKTPLV